MCRLQWFPQLYIVFCVLVLWVWRLFFLCFYFILYCIFSRATVIAVLQPCRTCHNAICSSCTLCCMCSWQMSDDDDHHYPVPLSFRQRLRVFCLTYLLRPMVFTNASQSSEHWKKWKYATCLYTESHKNVILCFRLTTSGNTIQPMASTKREARAGVGPL